MNAVILAGGRGTRLGNLTYSLPKPMIRIGDIPILEHQIRLLRKHNISKIIICTGYLSEKIENYFGGGSNWGVEIIYSTETVPLGTAGCVKELGEIAGKDFLVIYGDVMINMNLDYLIDFHYKKKGEATLVVHPNDHPYDSDLVEVDDRSKIINFFPKPHGEGFIYRNLVNAGAYVVKDTIFEYIKKNTKSDFGKDIFPLMLEHNESLYAYNTPEYIKDMGTSKRLLEVQDDFASSKFRDFNLSFARPAVFLDRDGVINKEKGLISCLDEVELIDNSAKAVKKINNTKYLSVVATNQPVVAKGFCTMEEVNNIHKKIETLLGKSGAKLDRIYFCPHHPDIGFPGEDPDYKIKCSCRKPNTAMIEKAKKDLNIDLENSYLVGDMTADIQAAKNANIASVAVRSGHGLSDKKYNVCPDIWADDLYNAVNIITGIEKYKKVFNIIYTKIKDGTNPPFTAAIGGIARSGKSTFAFFLKKYLKQKGCSTLMIDMDDWIIPAGKRKKSQDVIDRFRVDQFEKDLNDILEGKTIELKKYDPLSRKNDGTKTYSLKGSHAAIITGGPALNSSVVNRIAGFKIFMEIRKDTYKERFYKFYRWKKLDEENINKLYNQRLIDELPIILSMKDRADLLLSGEEE